MSSPSILSLSGPFKDGGSYLVKTDGGIMFIDNRFGSARKGQGPRGQLVWGRKLTDRHAGYEGHDMGLPLSAAEYAVYQPLIDQYTKRLSARRRAVGAPPMSIRSAWRSV